MEGEQVGGCRGGWGLDQGDVVDHLGEVVHNGEDNEVSIREWKTSDKIHCYMGPGMTGIRQGFQGSQQEYDGTPYAHTTLAATNSLMSLD